MKTKGKKTQGTKGTSRWLTTDDEERALRRERAAEEPMRVRPLSQSRMEIFQDYEVSRTDVPDAVPYRVELRSTAEPINSCTCPDFRKNFLGTCKHIERVLMGVRRPKRGEPSASPRAELFMTREPYAPLLRIGTGVSVETVRTLSKHVDVQGRLRRSDAAGLELLISACEAGAAGRVSQEIRDYLAELETREQLERVKASFREQIVAAKGAAPFLKLPLYSYQIDGMLHLAFKGRALLADEMGLGKTVQAVAAAAVMREVMSVKRVLVIAPASLKAEWEEQIRTFTSLPLEVLFGARAERLVRYRHTPAFFLIANYEQVVRDWREINGVLKPDLVILDEAQRIKNWKTRTAQNLKRLEARFAFVLTGTPLENRIDEVYSLTEFIDPSLFGSLFRFNRKFYRFDATGKMAGMQNLDDLHAMIGRIMLRRRKDDVEEQLPERVDNTYFVEMTPEQTTRYQEYEEIVARLCHLAKQRPLRPRRWIACRTRWPACGCAVTVATFWIKRCATLRNWTNWRKCWTIFGRQIRNGRSLFFRNGCACSNWRARGLKSGRSISPCMSASCRSRCGAERFCASKEMRAVACFCPPNREESDSIYRRRVWW